MNKVDKILAFDLTGPMAHFRKFFTNSSSLSYDFPPRTTIIGIIAGILGWQRDSYYNDFGIKECCVGIKIKEPTRSIQRTVNYLLVSKGVGGLNGSAGHTQIPIEIILPKNIEKDKLCYRVYFWHKNEKVMEELCERLLNRKFVYPVSLGLSEFLGNIGNVQICEEFEAVKSSKYVDISTVCNLTLIEERGLDILTDEPCQYIKEILPLSFSANREDMLPAEFIYERNGKNIRVKLKNCYFKLHDEGIDRNIVFMEGQ
ncbi:MAG: type I-B CRISPR-associated protein Cas5 [Tepidanaerobacter acetatoxydans]|uniref:type I-B CRISPR-associated protein Cas5b n=1 Tax=Tepidanaerobacter acetatoxydans TaxID=499229 RepID=UPI0026EF4EB0|nr:type I-B CRISPR-associated protein Cas5b [Tepidanaerobacter acetatoxydans]NLU09812.1 type I-B CRISPR-associated protein Cas5 [Tepidanaerobacter acetatoxydans]